MLISKAKQRRHLERQNERQTIDIPAEILDSFVIEFEFADKGSLPRDLVSFSTASAFCDTDSRPILAVFSVITEKLPVGQDFASE